MNLARVADLADQGCALLDAFRELGIDAVPLKGWHGLLVQRWPDPAARVMLDLDVLVPGPDIARAASALAELGYEDLGVGDPEGFAGHEIPARGRPGHAGSVELHRQVLVPQRAAVLDATDVLTAAVSVRAYGRTVRVPCSTHAMTLLIAHAQLQDDGARLLRTPLRALAEAAVMHAGTEGRAIDWDELADRFARGGATVPLAGFAVALDDLFGVMIPVPRRGGGTWWRAAQALLDRPRAAARVRQVASVPRALSAERMAHRYGAHTRGERARARATHVAHGVVKRVQRG